MKKAEWVFRIYHKP